MILFNSKNIFTGGWCSSQESYRAQYCCGWCWI